MSHSDTPKRKIAILGLKRSGKTTFLTILDRALTMSESPWKILPTGETISTMNTLVKRLFDQGLYPLPTSGLEAPVTFRVMREAGFLGFREGDWFELQAADVPGEAVKGILSEYALYKQFYGTYVKDCAAIIFLIAPDQEWESPSLSGDSYWSAFSSILAELGGQGGNELYAAFCITKLDMRPDIDSNSFVKESGLDEDKLEALACEILGPATKAKIDQFFNRNRMRWFGVSATGYYRAADGSFQSQSGMRVVNGESQAGIERPRELEPVGVVEAVEWVLNSIAKDDAHRRRKQRLGPGIGGLLNLISR